MSKKVIFFEVKGGNDKGPDGHRKDTMPMVHALEERGYEAEVIFYEFEKHEEIFNYVLHNAVAYVSRINPGNLKNEASYFALLRDLSDKGIIGMPHPDAMIGYGAKDALVKLTSTSLVPEDTFAYYTLDELVDNFPSALANGERVLKQNRGSTGEGIWRVSLVDKGTEHPHAKTQIKCTEAKDNHVEYWELGAFMQFCEKYIVGDNGMLVDMPFLPRIKEGEIRLLMLKDKPINVVHKKPADSEDAFSATLFSGAQYRYDSPEDWSELVEGFLDQLPEITSMLGGYDLPLIWTADFILDNAADGSDTYILGEMNCSCVGFTSQLELATDVAETIISTITDAKVSLA